MKNCYPDDWQWLVMNSRPLRSETTILGLVWWSHHNENVGSNPTPNVISNLHGSGKKNYNKRYYNTTYIIIIIIIIKAFSCLICLSGLNLENPTIRYSRNKRTCGADSTIFFFHNFFIC